MRQNDVQVVTRSPNADVIQRITRSDFDRARELVPELENVRATEVRKISLPLIPSVEKFRDRVFGHVRMCLPIFGRPMKPDLHLPDENHQRLIGKQRRILGEVERNSTKQIATDLVQFLRRHFAAFAGNMLFLVHRYHLIGRDFSCSYLLRASLRSGKNAVEMARDRSGTIHSDTAEWRASSKTAFSNAEVSEDKWPVHRQPDSGHPQNRHLAPPSIVGIRIEFRVADRSSRVRRSGLGTASTHGACAGM